jgi:hypothetical protein
MEKSLLRLQTPNIGAQFWTAMDVKHFFLEDFYINLKSENRITELFGRVRSCGRLFAE